MNLSRFTSSSLLYFHYAQTELTWNGVDFVDLTAYTTPHKNDIKQFIIKHQKEGRRLADSAEKVEVMPLIANLVVSLLEMLAPKMSALFWYASDTLGAVHTVWQNSRNVMKFLAT